MRSGTTERPGRVAPRPRHASVDNGVSGSPERAQKMPSETILQEWHKPFYMQENEDLLLLKSKELSARAPDSFPTQQESFSFSSSSVPSQDDKDSPESEVVSMLKRNVICMTEHTRSLLRQVRYLQTAVQQKDRLAEKIEAEKNSLKRQCNSVAAAEREHRKESSEDLPQRLSRCEQELDEARRTAEDVRLNNRRLMDSLRLQSSQTEAASRRAADVEEQFRELFSRHKSLRTQHLSLERQMLQMQERETRQGQELRECQESKLLLKIELRDLRERAQVRKADDSDSLASLTKAGGTIEAVQKVQSLYESRIKSAVDDALECRHKLQKATEEQHRVESVLKKMHHQLEMRSEVIERLEKTVAEHAMEQEKSKSWVKRKNKLMEIEKLQKTLQKKDEELKSATDQLARAREESGGLEKELEALQSKIHVRELMHKEEVSRAYTSLNEQNMALADAQSAFQEKTQRLRIDREDWSIGEIDRVRRDSLNELTARDVHYGERIHALEEQVDELKSMLDLWQARALDLASRAREGAERQVQTSEL